MALQSQSIREQRRHQMYPAFDPAEIERVRSFVKRAAAGAGEGAQVVATLHTYLAGDKPNLEPALESQPMAVQIRAVESAPLWPARR